MQTPPGSNIADVTEELRDKALKRTAEMIRKVDEVRRALELPVEQLPLVFKIYGKCVLALLAETSREEAEHDEDLSEQEPSEPAVETVTQTLADLNVQLLRTNQQMFDGTIRVLAQQNSSLREENATLRAEYVALRNQLSELQDKRTPQS